MAIKRLKPIQDTFIVKNDSKASFGGDEILELGTCYRPDASGCSRILLEFMTNELEVLLGDHSLHRAVLHLKYAYSENLPPVYGVEVTELEQPWTEGEGHVNDIPANQSGANWEEARPGVPWEIEGGEDIPVPQEDDDIIDAALVKYQYYTGYQMSRDLDLDVTEWVYSWVTGQRQGLGFMIKLSNEQIMVDRKARLCFYSTETHTVNSPYLEIVYDDSEHPEDAEYYPDVSKLVVKPRNLKDHYYVGEKVRIDLTVRPEFPPRVFATSSIYRDYEKSLPVGSLWGIQDEYTGEMWVPFTDMGTDINYDGSTNYFILDTDLLEPERYYRLLFELDTEDRRRVVDTKNVFRVTRHGEI